MRFCRALGMTAVILAAFSAAAAAGTRVGVVSAVDTGATLFTADGKSQPLALGAPLSAGDRIVTDAQGRAEILLLDQSSLSLSPNSEITIDDFAYHPADGSGNLTTHSDSGLFRYTGGALSKTDGAVKIFTPTTLLGVRGGIALIDVKTDGATRATFLYGEALTIGTPDGGTLQIARPGYFSFIAGQGAAPTAPAEADPAELAAEIASLWSKSASAGLGVQLPGGTSASLEALKKGTSLASRSDPTASFSLVEVQGYSSQARALAPNAQAGQTQPNFGFSNQPVGHGNGGEPGIGVNPTH